MEKPTQLKDEEIDLKSLKEICKDYIDYMYNEEEYHEDNDYSHYIYEVAMETIFGKDIWQKINNRD